MNFKELNVNQHYPELLNLLVSYTMTTAARYLEDVPGFSDYFKLDALEEFRIIYEDTWEMYYEDGGS